MSRDRKEHALMLLAVLLVAGLVGLCWWHSIHERASMPIVPTIEEGADNAQSTLDARRAVATNATDANSDAADNGDDTESPLIASLRGKGLWLRLIDAAGHSKPYVELNIDEELWLTLGESHPDKDIEETLVTNSEGRVRLAARQPKEIEHVTLVLPNGQIVGVGSPFEFAPDSKSEVVLRYPEWVTIRGRVLDLAGQPVKVGARVLLDSRSVASTAAGVHSFVPEDQVYDIDSEARFRFESIDGWFALSASAADVPAAESVMIGIQPATPSAEVDLYVATCERIVRMHVVSSSAFHREDAWVIGLCELPWPETPAVAGVSVERPHAQQIMRARLVGDAWDLELPKVGQWTIRSGCKGFETTTVPLPDAVDELTLELKPRDLRPPYIIQGRVTNERGEPLAASIKLLRALDLGHCEYTSADRNGEFRLTLNDFGADSPMAFVLAEMSGYGSGGVGPIDLLNYPNDRHHDLNIVLTPALTIAGRVSGLPPGVEARIVLRSPVTRFVGGTNTTLDTMLPGSLPGETGSTYDNGTFSIGNLTPGRHAVWFDPDDGITPPARVVLQAGDQNVRVELGSGLEGGLDILCRVVDDATSAPIAGARVEVRGTTPGAAPGGASGRTDASGMCNLRGHRAGRWSLHVRAAGFAFIPDRFTEYENGQEFAEVRLPMACTLDLELTDASGAPRSNVELCATTLAGELIDLQDRYGNYDGGYARSDASGHAVLVGLPAGRVHIVIGWKDGARLDLSADDATLLPANPLQCAVLDFDLVPGNRNKTKHLLR